MLLSAPGSESGVVSIALGTLVGFMTALCGYIGHEWGHLIGARSMRSVVHFPEKLVAPFLFHFDSDCNDRRQFLAMSIGGFAATTVVVLIFLAVLPREALAGRIALTLTLLGVVATVVLEFPPAWRVARGAPIPRGVAYRSSETGDVAS